MDKDNLSILKLLFFQSSFLMINLDKLTIIEKKTLNWFYQIYQIIFSDTCKFLNLSNENLQYIFINKKKLNNKQDFFNTYKNIFEYIELNKNDYEKLTI